MTNDYKKTGSELTRDVSDIPQVTEKGMIIFQVCNSQGRGFFNIASFSLV